MKVLVIGKLLCPSLLRSSGVPVCLAKYESLPYLYFDNKYRKNLYVLKDI